MSNRLSRATMLLAYQPLPQDIRDGFTTMLGWAAWIAAIMAIGRLFFVASTLWARPDQNEGGAGIARVVVGCIVIASAGITAGALLAPP